MDTTLLNSFHSTVARAQHVVIMTGAGVSAGSGIPTFRGAGGLWRSYEATSLATPDAFRQNPSLVWEFYHWRREVVSHAKPNPGHHAIAEFQKWCSGQGKACTLLTQNIDGLHYAAGSPSVVELHGSLWKVCPATRSGYRMPGVNPWEDRTQPLTSALLNRGAPESTAEQADIPVEDLPHDQQGRLLRPAVVWFGEDLYPKVLEEAVSAVEACDVFIMAGTSSVVYPAAGFAMKARKRRAQVAEFNLEGTQNSRVCDFVFQGRCEETLPRGLNVE